MERKASFYSKYIKRVFDFVMALVLLIILSPLLVVLAIVIKIKLGSPVIFSQDRPGKDEKIFRLYKFRTMSDKRDQEGNLLPDEMRLTSFGKKLRSTSLDELPELWNILKGEMSIVGPRPLATIYLSYYYESERVRHKVRPGLTGLAQVNGRNAISWEEKFCYDIEYVNNISFIVDVKIILATVKKVVLRTDIGQAEEAPISLHVLRAEKKE